MSSDSESISSLSSPDSTISPRKSIRRIHQDLRCFVLGDRYGDTAACHTLISNTMEALVKHGEDARVVAQARK